MRRRWSLEQENGQAAAEMALVLPIFAALVLGIAQFGIAFNNYMTLTDATRAGARQAAVSRFANDNGASAIASVKASAAGLNMTKLKPITVTATPNWTATGGTVTVTASYPYSINILGWTVKSGNLTSTTKERLE
jgi:Flp pilus assembly protein TadG